MWSISVEGLRLPFRGGLLPDEDKLLQTIELNVQVRLHSDFFIRNPILTNTVDYSQVVSICKELSQRKYDLLEKMALDIDQELRSCDQRICGVDIQIKKWPALGACHRGVHVHYKTS